jgi:NADH:ubiquinone oxidoreductase subunit 4 (subunit M)
MIYNCLYITYNNVNIYIPLETLFFYLVILLIIFTILNTLLFSINLILCLRFLSAFLVFAFLLFVMLLSDNWVQLLNESQVTTMGSSFFYMDQLSFIFCLMTIIVTGLCSIYIVRFLSLAVKFLIFLLSCLEILILICFVARNLILFYLCFELILFPMATLILVYGSRGRKVFAFFNFFIYTFTGSILLLIGMFVLYNLIGNLQFDFILHYSSFVIKSNMEIPVLFIFSILFVLVRVFD